MIKSIIFQLGIFDFRKLTIIGDTSKAFLQSIHAILMFWCLDLQCFRSILFMSSWSLDVVSGYSTISDNSDASFSCPSERIYPEVIIIVTIIIIILLFIFNIIIIFTFYMCILDTLLRTLTFCFSNFCLDDNSPHFGLSIQELSFDLC